MSQGQSGDLYFRQMLVGQMQNLCYLVGSRSSRQALLVDPAWAVDQMLDQAEQDGFEVVGALVTHYHQDHIGGAIFGLDIEGLPRLLERKPMPIHVNTHEGDGVIQVTGVSESDLVRHDSGDVVELGGTRIRLLHTPGHTPGSQCFLVEDAGSPDRLVAGDTLFLNACGRVDLPGASPEDMYHSLSHMRDLPDDTVLFPGHLYSEEPYDTMGNQKRTNPFLRVASLEQFLMFMGA